MALTSRVELPPQAFEAAAFADKLAQEYEKQGGTIRSLFVGFAGLVSARAPKVGADCLIALDRKLSEGASKPSPDGA
jgi:hypothetical protein